VRQSCSAHASLREFVVSWFPSLCGDAPDATCAGLPDVATAQHSSRHERWSSHDSRCRGARDTAQWLAIWRALPRFRGEASERTFIYRIAHNRGLSWRAAQRAHSRLHEIPERQAPGPAQDAAMATAQARDVLFARRRRFARRGAGRGDASVGRTLPCRDCGRTRHLCEQCNGASAPESHSAAQRAGPARRGMWA
jgi:hypothetical protein